VPDRHSAKGAPEERESRFWAFLLGAGAYAALLVA
jgi:hypothetical protein